MPVDFSRILHLRVAFLFQAGETKGKESCRKIKDERVGPKPFNLRRRVMIPRRWRKTRENVEFGRERNILPVGCSPSHFTLVFKYVCTSSTTTTSTRARFSLKLSRNCKNPSARFPAARFSTIPLTLSRGPVLFPPFFIAQPISKLARECSRTTPKSSTRGFWHCIKKKKSAEIRENSSRDNILQEIMQSVSF